jgi:Mrp family chromosome partitioning ATPase
MDQIDPTIAEQAGAGRHVAIAAVIVWALVAAMKSPAFPLDIPPKARPWLALALGQVYAVLAAVVGGIPWGAALVDGLVATTLAVTGQELGAAALRRGAP